MIQFSNNKMLISNSTAYCLLLKAPQVSVPLPPGPRSLPVVGHLLYASKLTHKGLFDLASRYASNSGLLHLRLGRLRIVAISNSAMAKQVLQTHAAVFCDRPASIAVTYLTYGCSDLAFSVYGAFWLQMRKLCVTKLFSRHHMSWATVPRKASAAIGAIARQSGHPVDVGKAAFRLTTSISFSAAFGSCLRQDDEKMMPLLQEISKLFCAFNVGDFFPWLKWWDFKGVNRRLKRARRELDVFIDKVIDEHMMNPKGVDDVNRDIVDEMLDFYNVGGTSTGQHEELRNLTLGINNIKAIIMDIIFAGINTVSSTIEWAMSELMRHPDERQKVQNELASVVGLHRRVEEADFDKLTYLKCVVKETLRLHPTGSIVPRETVDDIVLDGCFIPSRTHIMINIWAIQRDESAWKDPDIFCPSRFIASDIDFWGSFFEFIPFGAGRRSCPGMQLGVYIIERVLAELLHCFDWALPDGMTPSKLSMDDVFGITVSRAKRLVVVPTPRLSCLLIA